MYRRFFKRFLDVVLSFLAMVILSPLFLLLCLCVFIAMGHPVFFAQERIGKGLKPFMLYKFRSMTNAKGEDGNLLDERCRLTKFGKALRSSSFDELPELWLIFIGKMSFVGPRPQPTYYLPYYYEEEKATYSVKGGLIPPDSVLGVSNETWEEQIACEVEYTQHVTFHHDVKIILCTFKLLFLRVKEDYGADTRPHLNEYRASMLAGAQTKEEAFK